MTRDWKPGDVAMVAMGHGSTVAIWTGKFWAWSDGDGPYEGVGHCHRDVPARPLVVIDPEDREQVERLVGTFRGLSGWASSLRRESSNAMQAALRSLLAPPKPDEPTGLGAVVEDEMGDKWVWLANGATGAHWYRVGMPEGVRANWRHIAAVRVLSEGVTA